jgi:hypothetical protein
VTKGAATFGGRRDSGAVHTEPMGARERVGPGLQKDDAKDDERVVQPDVLAQQFMTKRTYAYAPGGRVEHAAFNGEQGWIPIK